MFKTTNTMVDIVEGDKVMYIDIIWDIIEGKRQTVKIKKFGVWDGEKVVLEDKERTTVRNKNWLTLIK